MPFLFTNLDVYKKSLIWADTAETLALKLNNKISSTFRDQLVRAALSIPLNISEGNGRWHSPDRRQFFWIARGSVFECVPLLELLQRRELITKDESETYFQLLEDIGKMLTRLVQSTERIKGIEKIA